MADWVNVGEWFTADQWQAAAAWATVLIAGVAAWIALRQLREHGRVEVERSRPYVVVDFAFRHYQLLVEISNIGHTPARDLVVQWDPQIRGTRHDRSEALARVLAAEKIPFLAPGRTMLLPVAHMPSYLKSDLPHRFDVTTKYKGDATGATYGESVALDLSHWSETLVALPYEKRLAEEAKRQTAELKRLTAAVVRILNDRNEGQ